MKKIIKWTLLILWMIVIFLFSNQAHSGDITHNALENVFFNIQPAWIIDTLNFLIRKLAHITEYLILFFLIISLLKEYSLNDRKIILVSIVFCLIYAITDELHQSLIPGRTSTYKDVLIDISGVLIASISYYIYNRKKLSPNIK